MTTPLYCAVLHGDFLAQIQLCAYLHAHSEHLVVGIPQSREELEALFRKVRVDVVVCGGQFSEPCVKLLRAELRRRGLRVVVLRHADRQTSVMWLRRRLDRACVSCAVGAGK